MGIYQRGHHGKLLHTYMYIYINKELKRQSHEIIHFITIAYFRPSGLFSGIIIRRIQKHYKTSNLCVKAIKNTL